jgi:outer membrane receptor protein involved in Fe transport
MSACSNAKAKGHRARAICMLAAALQLVWAAALAGQDRGFFTGTVVDNVTGQPVGHAIVSLVARGLSAETDSTGQFLLEGAPVGIVEVRFEATGYVTVVEQMQLTAADFVRVHLDPIAAVLDELLVVARRGRAPRVAAGEPIVPPSNRPSRNVLDLLEEMPGVSIMQGGGLTPGAFILIRGASSFRADLAPVIYLDGVRLDNQQVGNDTFHTLQMIPADDISRVRILKGPTETSAYPMGANGVILIETFRGQARNDQS